MLGPQSSLGSAEAPAGLEEFRQFVRHREDGAYRPLTGAKDMRTGWRRTLPDEEALVCALDVIYPLALTHVIQAEAGALEVTPTMATLCRQTGNCARARALPLTARVACAQALCRACVRVPRWLEGAGPGTERGLPAIPCPEVCSVFIALAEEAARWGGSCPSEKPGDPAVGWGEFHRDGNPVRNALIRSWPDGSAANGGYPEPVS